MKLTHSSLVAFSLAGLAIAHERNLLNNARHNAYIEHRDKALRQAPAPPATTSNSVAAPGSSSGAPAPATTAAATSATAASASVASSSTVSVSTPAVTTPTLPGTFIPPLIDITSGAPIETPLTMFTTFAAGATPLVSGAPPLPTAASIVGSKYPALDVVPPVDSPQVQQWLSEIDLSGVPNLSQTVDGSCASDPQLVHDQSRCWWTCGGCTRPTDIVACPDKDTWGVSYDDGPSPYTPKLVNYLYSKNITSTFFVVGSRVVSRPAMLQTEYMLGHEISVHTWSHPPLTTLTNEQIVAELGWARQAIKDVIGVSPVTMRPPYGDIDDRVRAVCQAMGLTPIIWTGSGSTQFDTDDWRIAGGTANGTSSLAAWDQIIATADTLNTGFIVLEHDLYQQSVDMGVGYFLPSALAHQPAFTLESIGECLHQPAENSYAETTRNKTAFGFNSDGIQSSNSTGGGSSSSGGSSGSSSGGKKSAAFVTRDISAVLGLAGVATFLGLVSLW